MIRFNPIALPFVTVKGLDSSILLLINTSPFAQYNNDKKNLNQ